jgi:DNA-binding beta-propeller fold protein YncE
MKFRLSHVGALTGLLIVMPLFSAGASGQIVLSANDSKVVLVDGVQTTVRNPAPDTVTIIDLGVSPPKVIGEVEVPASVVGPPQSVAIAPNGSIALVTAAMKIDTADPTKTIPDDKVTVIDLKHSPPVVIATLEAGAGASGVSINPAGTLALVANRSEGTVSVFTINGNTVKAAGKVDFGAPLSAPCHVVFTPDGKTALVTRNIDSVVSVLSIDGSKVEYTKRDIVAGLKPYGIEITPSGDAAVVANIGAGATGGADTVSLIDLSLNPPRVVNHITVGPTPEGLALSADGNYAAVTVMNGSNNSKRSPYFNDFGLITILRVNNKKLTAVTQAKVGHWCQGTAWSRDGRTVLVQCMVEKEIMTFGFDGHTLKRAGSIKIDGGPAGLRVSPNQVRRAR